jgi:hypothetical protein
MQTNVALGQMNAAIAPKQTAMQEHTQKIHLQVERLSECNSRLYGLLDRIIGSTPETSAEAKGAVSPNGVLYVAQFGVERIGQEIDRLQGQISRLESLA